MLSVIICTWNRCVSLRETLESFKRMTVPPDVSWELIVVDNNSTDATAQTIDDFKEHLPIVQVFESNPGKSYALNTAVKMAWTHIQLDSRGLFLSFLFVCLQTKTTLFLIRSQAPA